MSFGLQNGVIALTPTGRIDSEFPDGNDGSGVIPSWVAPMPDLSLLQVGTAFSVDVAAVGAFIDPGSPSSELGFNYVSGDTAVTAGFSFSGTVLSNSCLLVTSGAFRLVAVRNGISVLSPTISFSIAAIAGTDTVAPTIPTNVVAVPGAAVNTIALSFDPPCDIAPGSTPASGTAHVDLLVNGVVSAPSPIVTPANALGAPTSVNIGSISSPDIPAFNQSGKAWTFSVAGTGITSTTSEQCLLADWGAFSGARKITARLNLYTSSAGTAFLGLIMHETAAAGGRFIAFGLRPSNGTVGVYVITRATPGASSSQVASQIKDANGQNIVGPVYAAIERAADGKTFKVSYSLDQSGLLPITTQTITMGTTVHIGLFGTSQSAGTDIIGTIDEVAITNDTSIAATVNATSTVNLQLRSVDIAGNTSSPSIIILGVPKQPTSAGAIKLPLGNGFWTDNQFWTDASGAPAQEQLNFNSYFPTWSANPDVKWFYLSLTWGAIEGPTRGDYSKGFAAIDYVLNKLATAGHRIGVIIEVWQTFFNTTSITDLRAWPQYVVNNGWIQSCFEAGANRTQLKWNVDDLWAAENAMLVALCDRYNNHPLVYGISSGDESEAISVVDNVAQPANSGLSPGQTIINSAHYQARYLEQQLLMLSHLPNTLCYVPFNYLPPGDSTIPSVMANMINTIEAQYPKHAVYGGPDPFIRQTTFQKLVAGLLPTSGMGDIRNNILIMNRVQEVFLGNTGSPPTDPGITPGQIYDTAVANNAVMLTWNHETWEFYKYADQAAAIRARNGAVGTPPVGGSYVLV